MPKSNDNAAMHVRSHLETEEVRSQSSRADTAETKWRLVLVNYPMKELVRENVERYTVSDIDIDIHNYRVNVLNI